MVLIDCLPMVIKNSILKGLRGGCDITRARPHSPPSVFLVQCMFSGCVCVLLWFNVVRLLVYSVYTVYTLWLYVKWGAWRAPDTKGEWPL